MRRKTNTHLFSPNTPSHTTKRIIPWKIKKFPPSYLENNQTSPSHATQETTLSVSPHPKKIHLSQSLKKNLLWKGVELPHPPLLTQ
jgi:hypothetical protein